MSNGPTLDDFRAKVFRDRVRAPDWRVEKLEDDGETVFSGGDARESAIRYADREYGDFDEIEPEARPYRSDDKLHAEFRELWTALRLIRMTVEELAPPGSVPEDECVAGSMREAEAIVHGIRAIAGPRA
jgi:hypothetical protein